MRVLRVACLALALPLAACIGEGTGMGFLGTPAGASKPRGVPALQEVTLFRGNLVVAGPRGYCIDRQSLKRGPGGAFVLIASCESLTGKLGVVVEPAVVTLAIQPRQPLAQPPTAAELSALSPSGEVLQSFDGDGISYVQMSEGGDAFLPGGSPRYWRGAMLLNGHVIGLAVYGSMDSPVAGSYGRNLLLAQAETLRSRSPVREAIPVSQSISGITPEKPTGFGPLQGELFPESH